MCELAARALGKIGGAEACAALTKAIVGSKNDEARGWNNDAVSAVNEVRIGAADAIVEISPVCPQTIPILMATLGKPWSASGALTKLGSPAVPALVTASKSPNLSVREEAVQTLAAITPVPPAAGTRLRSRSETRASTSTRGKRRLARWRTSSRPPPRRWTG